MRVPKFRTVNFGKEGSVVSIRERMQALDITQVDMILELQKRGVTVQPPEMSSIIRGVYTYPKAKRVLDECDKILTELEHPTE